MPPIFGSNLDDQLSGTTAADTVFLMSGDDVYTNPGGNDLIVAGPGDDAFVGSSANETIHGEADSTR